MAPLNQLCDALMNARLISVHGPWSRVVAFHHLITGPGGFDDAPQPLWGGAAAGNGARFTPKGSFHSLYLAWDSVTALAEAQAIALTARGRFHPVAPPLTLLSIEGIVSRVLDLTDAATLDLLGTNEQEITGSWVKPAHPATQALGRAAFDGLRIAAIKYPSAKNIGSGVNLVVFPERLSAAGMDYLEVYDPDGDLAQRIGA